MTTTIHCRYCANPIEEDRDGKWRHVPSGLRRCQAFLGGARTAEPTRSLTARFDAETCRTILIEQAKARNPRLTRAEAEAEADAQIAHTTTDQEV